MLIPSIFDKRETGNGYAMVALLPMLAAQALAVFVYRRNLLSSVAWREGVATFWVVAMGASLSLIWQTYHRPIEEHIEEAGDE